MMIQHAWMRRWANSCGKECGTKSYGRKITEQVLAEPPSITCEKLWQYSEVPAEKGITTLETEKKKKKTQRTTSQSCFCDQQGHGADPPGNHARGKLRGDW